MPNSNDYAGLSEVYKSKDRSLEGRVVIVTGAGRGLGRTMALSLVASGARVTITAAHSREELRAVEAEASALATTECIHSVLADSTREDHCARVIDETLEKFGNVYGLINNAGRGMRLISETFNTIPTKFWETPVNIWKSIIDVNVNGPFTMTRTLVPHLIQQGAGTIINVSTSPITMIRAGYSPYGPSKAALEACSSSWAKDLQGTGVTVNVLLPGGAADTALLPGQGSDRRGADGQLLPPAVMAAPAVWLCTDSARTLNGRRLVAKAWDPSLPTADALKASLQPFVELPSIC